ncbi:MAG: cytochrome P450 [Microbacteriaceae bacterium]
MTETSASPDVGELAANFDLHDPRLARCPFAVFDEMRAAAPVHWSDNYGGHWVVIGRDEVMAAALDWRRFSSAHGVVLGGEKPQKFVPVEYDPPLHRAWRRLLNPLFSAEASAALEPHIAEHAESLLAAIDFRAPFDVVEQYAKPLNGYAVFQLVLGLSPDDARYCKAAANEAFFGADVERRAAGHKAIEEFAWKVYDARRDAPFEGGFLDTVRTAVIDGTPTTDEEIVGALQLIIIGASDTNISTISGLLAHLATHADDRRRIVADLSLVPAAMEEILRLESPSVAITRTATEDVELGGQHIRAGDKVQLIWAAANRDPEAYESPADFDLDRGRLHHLAFGAGPHRCIGAPVAKSVVTVAVERFLRRFPDFELAPGAEVTYRMGVSRGPVAVVVQAAASSKSAS